MSHEGIGNGAEYAMKDFEGTFVGFSPSDESGIGASELEATIDSQGIRMRWATGLEIQEDFFEAEEIREMSPQEVKETLLIEGMEIPEGMRVFDVAGLEWIFFDPEADPEGAMLMIRGGMGDLLGPTILFSPQQVEKGLFERAVSALEAEYQSPGATPRLAKGGLPPNEAE